MTSDCLQVTGLRVEFGGLVAVDDLSLTAPFGWITGLIGPNGAGKSTSFNACCGIVRPAAGSIVLGGNDLKGLGVAERSRRGLGRTFQRMELFDSLTVADNVALGREGGLAGRSPLRQTWASRAERRMVADVAEEAMHRCGITDLASTRVRSLSTGHRRLVELARVLAGRYRLLLLDEPSSGLDTEETNRFAEVVRDAVAQTGTGVLLVEHDIALVVSLCERITVIDFGRPIFEGTATEVQQSPVVRAAYLGCEEAVT